jgi:hypothetical protein
VLSYFSIDNALLKAVPSVYDLEDTPETEEFFFESCERAIQRQAVNSFLYLQGIHETSATRLANVPKDLQPEEWE